MKGISKNLLYIIIYMNIPRGLSIPTFNAKYNLIWNVT